MKYIVYHDSPPLQFHIHVVADMEKEAIEMAKERKNWALSYDVDNENFMAEREE